jgi:signal transduction histidine kinase
VPDIRFMLGSSFFLRSTALKHAAVYMLLFTLANLSANVIAHRMVLNFLDERLNASVLERFREISLTFDAGGIDAAVAMIRSHGPAIRGQETIYNLRDGAGKLLAGNTEFPTPAKGFSGLFPSQTDKNAIAYKLYRRELGPYDLTVGVSYNDTEKLTRTVTTSFAWATGITFILGMGGAVLVSVRLRRRVSRLIQIAHAIGHGELSRRLPISPHMDEIDHLATELNVAIGQLESSVTALKQVTTDIAHDLKTPLGRVFLMLDEVLNSSQQQTRHPAIEAALAELSSVSATFDALLRIAQIQSRDRKANFRRIDLQALLLDIFDAFKPISEEERYRLSLNCPSSGFIFGDADLVKQLCVNLLTNAFRHTPPGTAVEITLSSDAEWVKLIVSDNGPGIPAAERTKVFGRFYRLDKTRGSPGTGLGLSLVRAVADLHGGQILLSDNCPGLVCTVSFPVAVRSSAFGA